MPVLLNLKTPFMEKFMFIFHGGITDGSPEQMQSNMGKWMAWIEQLTKDGKYLAGEPLLPGGKLVTEKNKSATDGPFTEGKEVVGGFFLVEAADMNEAVSMCNDYPDFAHGGTVQVRQVMKADM
jgi:hypothetical protein